jgi:hypothetical protein
MAVSSFLPVFAGAAFVNRKVYTAFSPFTHPLILPRDTRLTAMGSSGTCPNTGLPYPASFPDSDVRAAVGC